MTKARRKVADKPTKKSFAIESFGVRIKISAAPDDILDEIERRIDGFMPQGLYQKITRGKPQCSFAVEKNREGAYVLYKSGKKLTSSDLREVLLKYFDWQIRLTIAERAVGRVFLHAGVVGWKGKAIIIPARSYQGKTTLVKTLTKLGAIYYSDEYAVLDEMGYVHPYPKTLSIRGLSANEFEQVEFPIESFGGVKGESPLPVGMILLTEYVPEEDWNPQVLSDGQGIMEMLSHTISIRYNPKFSLKVLNKTANRAIIVKSKRGEADEFALKALSFFEKKAFKA